MEAQSGPYPVELPAQAVEGLQLALPPDVGFVHSEELASVLLGQQAAGLVASDLGRCVCEGGGATTQPGWLPPKHVCPRGLEAGRAPLSAHQLGSCLWEALQAPWAPTL